MEAEKENKVKQKPQKPQASQGGSENPEADGGAPPKSKAQLKAERRAVQEAQRAAKAETAKDKTKLQKPQQQQQQQPKKTAANNATKKTEPSAQPRVPDRMKADDDKATKRLAKKLEKQQIPQRKTSKRKVGLFNHLHQFERESCLTKDISFSSGAMHPAILKLGLQYAEGIVCGSNARCIALLGALKQVIRDYQTPPHKELSRDLEAKITPYITFLNQCRPLSVSMGNAIKHIKYHISQVSSTISDTKAKEHLYDILESFFREKILLAGQVISKDAISKIQDGDVIMVYACSSLIRKVLCDAHEKGMKFSVVIVDSRPKMEGREMLRRLVSCGIKCSYVLITAVSYVMREVTKVFLGAHALMANGYVMSRVGSSQLALVARTHNVPVLVCCETYKFYDRAHTDSFVFNELGDPEDLVSLEHRSPVLSDWAQHRSLALLNLVYDITPPELISLVITEVGMVPCTSVPVVLRVKQVGGETT